MATINIKYDVLKEYGTLGKKGNLEYKVNLVSWNKQSPKIDVRPWGKDYAGKGVTFNKDEVRDVFEIMKGIFGTEEAKKKATSKTKTSKKVETEINKSDDILEELIAYKNKKSKKSENTTDEFCNDEDINNLVSELDEIFKKNIKSVTKEYGVYSFAKDLGKRLTYIINSDKITQKSIKTVEDLKSRYEEMGITIWNFKTSNGYFISTMRK